MKEIIHIDRQSTIDTFNAIDLLDRREFLSRGERDLWDAVRFWKRVRGDGVEVRKVKAHVDRLGRARTEHEEGNHEADRVAGQLFREDTAAGDPRAEAERLHNYRTERWRLYGRDTGLEITEGIRTAVRMACAESARARDQSQRHRAGLFPRPRMAVALKRIADTKTRREMWGSAAVEAMGDEADGITPDEWLLRRGGRLGGGSTYKRAQLVKFLHGKLLTQHSREQRRNAQLQHLPCSLCSQEVIADNDHCLFYCPEPEVAMARREWAHSVLLACEAALPLIGNRLYTRLTRRWSLVEPSGVFDQLDPTLGPEQIREEHMCLRGWWPQEWVTSTLDRQDCSNPAATLQAMASIIASIRQDWKVVWLAYNRALHTRVAADTPEGTGRAALREWRELAKRVKWMAATHRSQSSYILSGEVERATQTRGEGTTKMREWVGSGRLPVIVRKGTIESLIANPVTSVRVRAVGRKGGGINEGRSRARLKLVARKKKRQYRKARMSRVILHKGQQRLVFS